MLGAFGVDTLDPAVSTRRVMVLLERMPPAWLRPGEAWSTEAELLALLVDHVAALTWITMRAHGAKGAKRPSPLPRPRGRAREAASATMAPRRASQAPEAGTVRHSSWLDAAQALAGTAGMRSRGG